MFDPDVLHRVLSRPALNGVTGPHRNIIIDESCQSAGDSRRCDLHLRSRSVTTVRARTHTYTRLNGRLVKLVNIV